MNAPERGDSPAPSDPLPTTSRAALPFALVALLAFPLAMLPPDGAAGPQLIAAAIVTLTVIASVVLIPWESAPRWWRPVPAITYLAAVAMLRHAEGGAASGYAPLLMLPVLWVALYGGKADLLAVTLGIAIALGVPIVVFGEPTYPASEWRRLALWMVIAPVTGHAVQRLVAEVRAANTALEDVSRTDPLTGLPNRRGWDERVADAITRAQRGGGGFHIALLDLDHFKRFNDTYGHHAGDDLLRDAAHAWRQRLRAIDTIARWGGEEFAVLLNEPDPRGVLATLERIREATPGDETASIGVATWVRGEDPLVTLSRADLALYQAKAQGRDRTVEAGTAIPDDAAD